MTKAGFVEILRDTQARLLEPGLRALGIGREGDPVPFRPALGDSFRPVLAVAAVGAAVTAPRYLYAFLAPDLEAARGISSGAFGLTQVLQLAVIGLAAVPAAALVRGRLASASRAAALGCAMALVGLAFAGGAWSVFGGVMAAAAAAGLTNAAHPPALASLTPPEVRVRGFAVYGAAGWAGILLVAGAVGLTATGLAPTWRTAILLVAAVSAICALLRMREPNPEAFEVSALRTSVERETGSRPGAAATPSTGESIRRVLALTGVPWLLVVYGILGMLGFPLVVHLVAWGGDRWRWSLGEQSLFLAVLAASGIAGVAVSATRSEAAFAAGPERALRLAGAMMAAAAVGIVAAPFLPATGPFVIIAGTAVALLAAAAPPLNACLAATVPVPARPHAFALAGVASFSLGSIAGLAHIDAVAGRFGLDVALATLAIPALHGAYVLRRTAAERVAADVRRTVGDLVEREFIGAVVARGDHLPLLACRGIDFSYGQLQVLFGVDLTVDEGEIVALLGTNGAGKSTLLRVISGLGMPSRGTVRFRGADITYRDPGSRLRLGITQIPGGRAIFGPMTVVENLRVFGYSLGRNRRAVERAIDAGFAAFPRLAERRNQLAGTLSGGEQQMLGLARALVVEPKLLLIDELSLGLAPKIVAELLEMVRRINQGGTAVVLVEQSVNVALLLAEHAYFMEKGAIGFDGPARALLGRTDLLRSVFLEGAAKGMRES